MAKENKSSVIRLEQSGLVKTLGARIHEARDLCNMSQLELARKLGYSNSSKLSKIENSTDTNSVPHWMLVRVARVCEVSLDWLYGESQDWEYSARMTQEREVSKWVFAESEKMRRRDMDAMRRLNNRIEADFKAVALMTAASDDMQHALQKFTLRNKGFDDMPAGAMLASAVERSTNAAIHVRALGKKFRFECAMLANTNQMSMGF